MTASAYMPAVVTEIAWNAGFSTPAASRTWTDVSEYVELNRGIAIGYGRQDERSLADANTCSLTFDNRDGRFTAGLASSPYYPNVKIGRPIRVCVNLCSAGDSGTFEADATGWAGSNATVARSTAQAHSGSASLSVTATAAANMSAQSSSTGLTAHPVAPSVTYRASAWVRTAVTGRSVDVRVNWYDSGGVLLSTSDSTNVTDSTTWQQVTLTATAPSNAVYARVQAVWISPAAGEIHYLDDVRLDFDRFTGYVDEWPVEWPGSDATSYVTVTASSRLARLGLNTEFRSVIEEEIHLDSPASYYTLGEPEAATSAGDSTGSGRLRATGTGTAPTFGSATGPATDGLTAVQFVPGKWLKASSPAFTAPTAVTIEAFFSSTYSGGGAILPIIGVGGFEIVLDTTDFADERIVVIDSLTTEIIGTAAPSNRVYTDGQTRHIAATWTDGAPDAWTLLVDGVVIASANINAETSSGSDWTPTVGGSNNFFNGTTAVVAHAAFYSSAVSTARLAEHATAGLTGWSGESTDVRLQRYTRWAGLPASEVDPDTGSTVTIAHVDSTGQNVVSMLRLVEASEGGVLFDERDGTLRMHNRSERYTKAAALTLNMAAQQVGEDFSPRLDRSSIINDARVTNSDGTLTSAVKRTSSIEAYGLYVDSRETQTTDDEEPYQLASWLVNTYAEPRTRVPALTVDVLNSGASVPAVLALNVSSIVAVTGMPSQAEASSASYFVEGYTESIGHEFYSLSFNVSPAYPYTSVLVLDDATRVLDSAVVGY